MKTEIIINLKEGVQPGEVLPSSPLEGTTSNINIERVHNILPPVNSILSSTGGDNLESTTTSENLETVFQNQVYPNLDDAQKKLYRSFKIEVPEDEVEALVSSLESNPKVEYVQFNRLNDLMEMAPQKTSDPLLNELYGLHKIECLKAWEKTMGEEVVVAVIDTGVDYNHPDLKDNMWIGGDGTRGFNFSENNNDPMDYHSHGTHVAGTIAAVKNNFGIVGVAPKAKIMAIKIFPNATDTACSRAIVAAVNNGAKVINNSWGPTSRRNRNPEVETAIDYAISRGVCVVFAAGNSDDDVQFYAPANYKGVISVAATDQNDQKAGFSNYGELVTVAAPGKDILSCKFNTKDFVLKNGTSMAAPHVAGLAALILAKDPQLSLSDLVSLIKESVDKVKSTKPIGTGRINAYSAVGALKGVS